MISKICTKCGIEKPLTEYFKDKQKSSGYRPDCKKCNIKRSIAYNKKHKERNTLKQIKWSTGISEQQFLELFKYFGGKCAICGTTQDKKRLAIDHSHKTKLVRGLLCTNCNLGLGSFRDDEKLLRAAIKYLNKNFSDKGIIHKEKKHKNGK